MSVLQVQDMVCGGDLDNALSYINLYFKPDNFEGKLYESWVHLTKGDFSTALDLAVTAHDIINSLDASDLHHQSAHVAIAYPLLKLGKLDEAYYYIKIAEKQFLKYHIQELGYALFWFRTLYQVKGGIDARFGNIETAIRAFEKCLEISLIMNRKGLLGGVYNNLGYANNLFGRSEIANEYYQKSLQVAEELNSEYHMYYPLSNIGIYYFNKGNMVKAMEYHERALKIATNLGNKAHIASQYRDMSQILRYKGDLDQALTYLQTSLKLREEIGNQIWLTFTLIYLVELSTDLHEHDLAIEYSNQLMTISSECRTNKLINQISRMGEALILKSQARIKPKSEAMAIFKQIIEEDMLDYDTTVNAILHLCELLLFEIKLTQEEEVLIEVHTLTAKLIQIAEENKSHVLIGDILGLQANIAIIEGNFKLALKLYDRALELANKFNSIRLEKKLKDLKQEFISESEIWSNLTNENNPLMQRIQKSNIQEYLRDIMLMKDNLSQK
ncbi:MAG: tetratricopeptide repeat protein [Candidatus Kariarchaeaceae archaeon]|jgi:tetratricopeptide (TPR) repeat protein